MISILIVEDQKPVQEVLKKILAKCLDFYVIGMFASPLQAMQFLKMNTPDVIILDVLFPEMSGLEFLDWLEKNYRPIPVILLTVLHKTNLNLKNLNITNLFYIQKPNGTEEDFLRMVDDLISTLYKIKNLKLKNKPFQEKKVSQNIFYLNKNKKKIELIAIGASTGGTQAIESILKNFSTGMPPIVIVQHMPSYFTKMLASRLNQVCKLNISEAKDRELMQNDHVYIAPGGIHCHVVHSSGNLYISLRDYEKVSSHKPSVDVLFYSIAESKIASKTIAILLTGMGSDGAAGLLAIRKNGGITIGQDEGSSIVYGMPKVAYDKGAVIHQISLQEISSLVMQLLKND